MQRAQTNYALVFLKPEAADRAPAVEYVRLVLERHAVQIRSEGVLSGRQIAAANILDQHYLPIATAACRIKARDLPLTAAARQQFRKNFGLEWDSADVINAVDLQERWQLDAERLAQLCSQAEQRTRLAPGLYVAKISNPAGDSAYVVNGFYPKQRQRYTHSDAQVHWLDVCFDCDQLSWQEFRSGVIGATDPAVARPGSLRQELYSNPGRYDLAVQPSMTYNCVHASASPLEGSRERLIWCGLEPQQDVFLQLLHEHGLDWRWIQLLLENPLVRWAELPEQPLFDLVEDLDAPEALQRLLEIGKQWQQQAA